MVEGKPRGLIVREAYRVWHTLKRMNSCDITEYGELPH